MAACRAPAREAAERSMVIAQQMVLTGVASHRKSRQAARTHRGDADKPQRLQGQRSRRRPGLMRGKSAAEPLGDWKLGHALYAVACTGCDVRTCRHGTADASRRVCTRAACARVPGPMPSPGPGACRQSERSSNEVSSVPRNWVRV